MNQLADAEILGTKSLGTKTVLGASTVLGVGGGEGGVGVGSGAPYRPKDSPSPELNFSLNARTVVGVAAPSACKAIGDYWSFAQIAAGGMATVHVGYGSKDGKRRTVAIKLLKAAYVEDEEFASMFASEARLASRIQHPNVVRTLDFVQEQGELALVMDYVPGEALSKLLVAGYRGENPATPPILRRVLADVLRGLHAAHEARDAAGNKAHIVHRDVSPQNILVGVDGVARVLDFGIAQAVGQASFTRDNEVRGKLSYVAPEQLEDTPIDLRADIYSASVVLWEALTCKRLFQTDDEAATLTRVLNLRVPPPSYYNKAVSADLDAVVLKGLNRDRALRYQTAWDMARAVAASGPCATRDEVADWVNAVATQKLAERQRLVAAMHGAAIDQPSEYTINRADLFANGLHTSGDSEFPPSSDNIDGAQLFTGELLDQAGMGAAEFTNPENSFADLPMVSDAHLLTPLSSAPRLRRRLRHTVMAAATLIGGALLGTTLVLHGANFLERTEASEPLSLAGLERNPSPNLAAEPVVSPLAMAEVAIPTPANTPVSQVHQTLQPALAPASDSPPIGNRPMAAPVTTVPAQPTPEVATRIASKSTTEPTRNTVKSTNAQPQLKTGAATPSRSVRARNKAESTPGATTAPSVEPSDSLAKQPAQTPDCDPPYAIDASGIRRYKLECL